LAISNAIYKVATSFTNGSQCSRFGDGNRVNVGLDTINVIIFGTIQICAHLQGGTSSGTFGKLFWW
jgi:hypothetical protein